MAWRRPGDKPLSEPMMVRLPMHTCVTRPQWVKQHWRIRMHASYEYKRISNGTTRSRSISKPGTNFIRYILACATRHYILIVVHSSQRWINTDNKINVIWSIDHYFPWFRQGAQLYEYKTWNINNEKQCELGYHKSHSGKGIEQNDYLYLQVGCSIEFNGCIFTIYTRTCRTYRHAHGNIY